MNIIPAIDISEGKVIRLELGKTDKKTVYSDNPSNIIKDFIKSGAKWVHIIDIDGATRKPNNRKLIKRLLKLDGIFKEVGGGLRDEKSITSMLENGADRVIVSTIAYENPKIIAGLAKDYPGKIVVALDFLDNRVKINGWAKDSGIAPIDFAKRFLPDINLFLLTDISKDGMLTGIDEKFYRDFSIKTGAAVIISGGVKSVEDIKLAKTISMYVEGVVVGKALYEGCFDLKEALRVIA